LREVGGGVLGDSFNAVEVVLSKRKGSEDRVRMSSSEEGRQRGGREEKRRKTNLDFGGLTEMGRKEGRHQGEGTSDIHRPKDEEEVRTNRVSIPNI
jgi:hypothetical protein